MKQKKLLRKTTATLHLQDLLMKGMQKVEASHRGGISEANDMIICQSDEITGNEAIIEYLETKIEILKQDIRDRDKFDIEIMLNTVKVRKGTIELSNIG